MELAQLRSMFEMSPFIKFLQLDVASWDEATQTLMLTMPMRAELERAAGAGQLHGGVVASLLDTAATFAVIAATGRPVPTIDLRVDYLRPVVGTIVQAQAQIVRVGQKIATADARCLGEDGRVAALGRATFLS